MAFPERGTVDRKITMKANKAFIFAGTKFCEALERSDLSKRVWEGGYLWLERAQDYKMDSNGLAGVMLRIDRLLRIRWTDISLEKQSSDYDYHMSRNQKIYNKWKGYGWPVDTMVQYPDLMVFLRKNHFDNVIPFLW